MLKLKQYEMELSKSQIDDRSLLLQQKSLKKIWDSPEEEIAAYYLKNIVLLQAFPDGNHRTALYAVELFLEWNGCSFDYAVQNL